MLSFTIFVENKLMRNLILLITIGLFTIVTACGPEKGAAKKPNAKAKTAKSKKANPTKKGATANAATSKVKMNADQKAKVKKIEAKYDKRLAELRKKNDWAGEKNAKKRKMFNADKAKELKAVLGGKYKDYIISKMPAKKKK